MTRAELLLQNAQDEIEKLRNRISELEKENEMLRKVLNDVDDDLTMATNEGCDTAAWLDMAQDRVKKALDAFYVGKWKE